MNFAGISCEFKKFRKESDKGVIVFMDSRFRERMGWISDWVRKETKIVPDKDGVFSSYLSNFWKC